MWNAQERRKGIRSFGRETRKVGLKKAYNSVRREVLHNILIQSGKANEREENIVKQHN